MDNCKRCGGPTVALFTSYACKHECDKPDHLKSAAAIAARQAVTAAKVAAYQKAYEQIISIKMPVPNAMPIQTGTAQLPPSVLPPTPVHSLPSYVFPAPAPPGPCPWVLGQVVCNQRDCQKPHRYDCGGIEAIDYQHRQMRIRWLDDGSLSGPMGWNSMYPLIVPTSAILP